AALSLVLTACGSDFSDCPPQAASSPAAAVAGEEAGPVDSVSAEGAVEVEIAAGATGQGRVECDADRLPKIHVEAREHTIHVWTDSSFDAPGESACVVKLSVSPLRALDVSGSGDVRVLGRADGLATIHATGSGDVKVEELSARSVQVTATGSG